MNTFQLLVLQKIKNCIEQLVEANNRFKIHSVKVTIEQLTTFDAE